MVLTSQFLLFTKLERVHLRRNELWLLRAAAILSEIKSGLGFRIQGPSVQQALS